jgi:hypothetical protein
MIRRSVDAELPQNESPAGCSRLAAIIFAGSLNFVRIPGFAASWRAPRESWRS